MASAAGNGRTRRQANRLPATPPSRHEAGEQIHGLPAPIQIRWYRTRALTRWKKAWIIVTKGLS
jgi:hypothetical protein